MNRTSSLFLFLGLLASPLAQAEDPVDIGALKNSEIQVVQKALYAMDDTTEFTMAGGLSPFDPFTLGTKVQLSYASHTTNSRAWEVQVGAGFGLKKATYKTLDSPAYGKVPEAYRYLGSITGGILWSPIYAKMNYKGQRVFHHDVYIPAVAGVTVEQAVDRNLVASALERLSFAPTVGVGLGVRVFLHNGNALRVELRDDWMLQHRGGSDTWALKQNVGLHIGYAAISGGK
ncbi:MAG: hypothetical protein VX519_11045 [Myxococcota bacterium]|nr:hypothetical protein [Myxococcota bacterium]